ncbi:unnamed protein product [Haemonchus placei]|uniref:non-specific serine/threonine protein kinase n=1 Tax=Haemonchus placei TaxID=6290 RepID=A0A0N4X1M1_HAEPC|nr:unnamed protein product [Haemonchus placei]
MGFSERRFTNSAAFKGYIATGMVPAVWVPVVSHLMSHCFAKISIEISYHLDMIVKLIIAYPYHVLHTVLMYKFNEVCEQLCFAILQLGHLPSLPIFPLLESLIYCGYTTRGAMERICIQADGLSAPKIFRTKGSDGKIYKIIWKNEDVRQDCLVEQLFSVVNGILNRSEPSAFLRTYKVVPLDSKCGIIEFCQGTVSLSKWVCFVKESMRTNLKDAARTQVNEASRMHFFYEQHSTVQSWTQAIANYRRSLAQWSIVTYVVGLGDRHLSNVLFEMDTCKLVHIDLGMILEYSKRTLPIPERVPFRLTRDLLDPILIEGTDGQLLEGAVRTMRLLRESKHVILGLASVLLRETISNFEEVESSQGERPSFVSETAIARLRDKLSGTDDTFGVFAKVKCNVKVRRLFAEATSVDNLSRMFVGWMPFV